MHFPWKEIGRGQKRKTAKVLTSPSKTSLRLPSSSTTSPSHLLPEGHRHPESRARHGNQAALPTGATAVLIASTQATSASGFPASKPCGQFRVARLYIPHPLRRQLPGPQTHTFRQQLFPPLTSTRRVPPLQHIPPSAPTFAISHPYTPRPCPRVLPARTSISDRSSILSQGTTTSRTSTSLAPPSQPQQRRRQHFRERSSKHSQRAHGTARSSSRKCGRMRRSCQSRHCRRADADETPERRTARPVHRHRSDCGIITCIRADQARARARARYQTGRTRRACDMTQVETRVAASARYLSILPSSQRC